MKNLKRILSLALASVMVMGMMVVGASAAFNDQDEINPLNVDAINTMVALKVLSGKEGGKFDPKGGVTRAEMATMIAVALHGGDPDFRGTTTTGFTDVDGITSIKWAAKYIKYCVDQGIISGIGGNKFNPQANVTAQEAATMILTAMGYRKEMLSSKTSDWAAVINQKAEINNLYNDTAVTDYTQDLDRQNAAQMVYNGITTAVPTLEDSYSAISGEHSYTVKKEGPAITAGDNRPTILESAFKADIKYGVMAKVTYDEDKYEYTLNAATGIADSVANNTSIKTEKDASALLGQTVKVIYSDSNDLGVNSTIIGLTTCTGSVLKTGAVKDLKWSDDKLNGYSLDGEASALKAYVGFNTTTGGKTVLAVDGESYKVTTMTDVEDLDTYRLVDTDGDNKVDLVLVTDNTLEQVTEVKDGVVAAGTDSEYTIEADKAEDVDSVAYEGIAKGDWVIVTVNAKGENVLTKATTVEGKVTALDQAAKKIKIGTTWYKAVDATAYGKVEAVGATYTLVIMSDYVADASTEDEVVSAIPLENVVFVTKVGNIGPEGAAGDGIEDNDTTYYQYVQVINSTGTKQTIKVAKFNTDGTEKTVAPGTPDVVLATTDANKPYTFSVEDDLYTLTKLDSTVAAAEAGLGYASVKEDSTAITVNRGQIKGGAVDSTYRINSDAIFFVVAGTGDSIKVKMLTGAQVAAWSNDVAYETKADGASFVCATQNKTTGLAFAEFGVLYMTGTEIPGTVDEGNYGWLVSNAIVTLNSENKRVVELTIFDGLENVTVQLKGTFDTLAEAKTEADKYEAGTPVSYTDLGEGKVDDVTDLTDTGTAGKVTAFDEAEDIIVFDNGTEQKFSDFTVIFVNTKDNVGEVDGTVKLAGKDDNNVLYSTDAGEKYIFVDTNNKIVLPE